MSIVLSHSSKELYQQCGYKWYLHYVKKLRSPIISSPLLLGHAMDGAFSRILLEKMDKNDRKTPLSLLTEFQVFDEGFSKFKNNNEEVVVKESTLVRYSSSDYTLETLKDEDIIDISKLGSNYRIVLENIESITEFINECKANFKSHKHLDNNSQIMYNIIHWHSLRRKCHYLLEKYREDVLSKIEKVYSIQEKVELKDESDLFIGYIDFVASFNDEPGKKYVCDNKFASKAYASNAVSTSDQLSTYCEYKGINSACYIVVEKSLRKKVPLHRIQILKDTIPESQFNKTFDGITKVFNSISAGDFKQNFESKCFFFGAVCPYYDYCRSGDSSKLKDCSK